MLPVPIGDPAPDFIVERGDGSSVALSTFRGLPVILTFFDDGWDPARRAEVAIYNRLVARASGARAELIAVACGDEWCDLELTDGRERLPLLAVRDPEGDVAARYGVRGLRALFVIDADGAIRWRHAAPAGMRPCARDVEAALAALGVHDASAGDAESAAPLRPPTRREFIATALGAALALAFAPSLARAESAASSVARRDAGPDATPVTLRINGRDVKLALEPRVTLLDALREYAGLTGTKKGCDHGQCGACTVHVNGRRVLSCLTLAMMAQGSEVTTIEGLASGDALHPVQQAFVDRDAFQCGYCTPGQIMSAAALLREPCGESDADVRECMSGNICRCGAYPNIVAAIQDARRRGAISRTTGA